jgi:hypothetical protein
MELSVIIVNYNAAQFIASCLTSIQTYIKDVEHEVCVVDNASTDGGLLLIKKMFPYVKLQENQRNLGFAAAVNQGLKKVVGKYTLWLNPDSELLNNGIVDLVQYLTINPDVGILGPLIVDPDGAAQLSCRSFPSYQTALFNRYSLLTKCFPQNKYSKKYLNIGLDRTKITEVDWVSGSCLLHRREVVDDIGLLDERFFMYCEDVDFCLRARQRGWSVRYHPGLRILHHIAGSSRQVQLRMVVERHRSMWRYYTKHFPRHILKDSLVAMGVSARCGLLLFRDSFH